MLQKLKWKLVVINVVLLIVVLLAVFVLVYILLESELKKQERTLLSKVAYDETIFDDTYYIYDIEEDREYYEDYLVLTDSSEDDILSSSLRMFYVILDSDRDIMKYRHNIFIKRTDQLYNLLDNVDELDKKYGEIILSEEIKLSFLIEYNEYDEKLYVFVDMSNRDDTMGAYVYTAFVALAGAVICVFIISVYIAGRSIKPVRESVEKQDKFIADASHELRTPIAVIRSNVELIMDSPEQTVADNMKWLEYIHKEAKRMTKMTEDLLVLSRADAKNKDVGAALKEEVDLSGIVLKAYESFKPLFAENNLSAGGMNNIEQGIYIKANEFSINQLLAILIDNAIKYTKEGGVLIKLEKDESFAYIRVIDTGIGMPKDMTEKIFERFFRIDKARSKATGGFGLGLSIAKAIAEDHGGEITVESEPDRGSEFIVRLPLTFLFAEKEK